MQSSLRRIALVSVLAALAALTARADEPGLTFLGWSDQHVTVGGDASHLVPAIGAMNAIEGTAYPAGIGGKVERPAFVFGCGDITEWPTNAAKGAYNQAITKQLKIPAYDMAGNHDEGGKSPSQTLTQWIIARHGALSYTFEKGGVHFIAAFSKYNEELNNPAQAINQDAIAFIREQLAKVPKGQPAVVALHQCLDSITNRDELVGAFGGANVIMVLGGHYHKHVISEYRGYHFVELPSPASTTQISVIRIRADRLVASAYDYKSKAWNDDAGAKLDVAIKGPTAAGQEGDAPSARKEER